MGKDLPENTLKQDVGQLLFDIRKQVRNRAYWNATQLAHDLFELLNSQPYVEKNNPPLEKGDNL